MPTDPTLTNADLAIARQSSGASVLELAKAIATARAEGYRAGVEAAARKCRSVAESSSILATVAAKAGQSHVWSGHESRCAAAEGLEIAIRALAPVPDTTADGPFAHRLYRFDCATCGKGIGVDEDGCCTTCGEDATIVEPIPPATGATLPPTEPPFDPFEAIRRANDARAEAIRIRATEAARGTKP